MTLTQFAKSHKVHYSTAWRWMMNGHVAHMERVPGKDWMVYPESFVRPAKRRNK